MIKKEAAGIAGAVAACAAVMEGGTGGREGGREGQASVPDALVRVRDMSD